MRYVLAHSDCKLVFVAPDWEARVRELLATIDRPVAVVVVGPRCGARRSPRPSARRPIDAAVAGADALALLMYTSGTTGVPKGVMLTQANLAANAQAISAEHGLSAGDRVLAVLPLYHINAFAVTMLAPLAHGGSLAMPPQVLGRRASGSRRASARCTWINVVPTIISYLLEGAAPPREQIARLRFCRSASAALPPEHLRAFEQQVRHRHHRDDGADRDRRAGVLESARSGAAQGRLGRPRVGLRGARRRRRAAAGRRRHDRRDRDPRAERDARLLQERPAPPRARSRRTAGCAPATSAIATPTASSSSPAASRS